MKNTLTKRSEDKATTSNPLGIYLSGTGVKNRINELVGSEKGQRFIASVISAVQGNNQLSLCTPQSIVSGALIGHSLELSPSPQLGYYYLVPFKNKGIAEAQFILGYKGYLQLAMRSGQYKSINVLAIKQGELKSYDVITEEINIKQIENEIERETTPTIGYYARFSLVNGFTKGIYWSKEKMENHAIKYSKGYQAKKGYTFWEKDFDGMAIKTLIRHLLSKLGIMSIDMQTAYTNDMGVIEEDNSVKYVDGVDFDFDTSFEDEKDDREVQKVQNQIQNSSPTKIDSDKASEEEILLELFGSNVVTE